MRNYYVLIVFISVVPFVLPSYAQFIDDFNKNEIIIDKRGINGWTFFAGDGFAIIDFSKKGNDYASITVDATKDKRNIWWALIRRRVSEKMNLNLLSKPEYELRIEAKLMVSDAPKRVNLHLNTQRTTDFHSHLMEFDIPDTTNWHTISLTTKNFDAVPGDTVYGQLALMDWGLGKYSVDIDYIKVDIVNIDSAEPDEGVQVPYHPPVPDVEMFSYHIPVLHDVTINPEFPDLNFNNWSAQDENQIVFLLTSNNSQFIIMRWDLNKFKEKKISNSGLLELITYSLERLTDYEKDFGMIRVSEIIGGEREWKQSEITYNSFCKDKPLNKIINSQMIIDVNVSEKKGEKTFIKISKPVLQRMIDGKTYGLAVLPLGAVNASFYSMENKKFFAKLHFSLDSGL